MWQLHAAPRAEQASVQTDHERPGRVSPFFMEKITCIDQIQDGRFYLATERVASPRTIVTAFFSNALGVRSYASYEDIGKHWCREVTSEEPLRDYLRDYSVVEITRDQAMCLVHNWKR